MLYPVVIEFAYIHIIERKQVHEMSIAKSKAHAHSYTENTAGLGGYAMPCRAIEMDSGSNASMLQ